MRVVEIKYEHRVPVAQYETKMAGATAVIMEGENAQSGFDVLKKFVEGQIVEEKKEEVAATKEEKVVEKVKETPKVEEKQEVKTTTEVVEEKKVEDKPVKKVTKKKATKKKATTKKDTRVVYDRMDDSHRKELGALLGDIKPQWNDDIEFVKKAGEVSKSLTGKMPLYEKNGDVTEEFKNAVREGVK